MKARGQIIGIENDSNGKYKKITIVLECLPSHGNIDDAFIKNLSNIKDIQFGEVALIQNESFYSRPQRTRAKEAKESEESEELEDSKISKIKKKSTVEKIKEISEKRKPGRPKGTGSKKKKWGFKSNTISLNVPKEKKIDTIDEDEKLEEHL